ncbi:MAG: hypothetical protein ACTSRK_01670 [Promethearchaeota archaeon]
MTDKEDRITYLVDLFQSIDVREKGIEYLYDLLLEKQSIEDIKEFVDTTGISLKRVYKVIQLLEKLGLIQVYNRPMIVNVKDPIPSWEAIISEKIKEVRSEADKKIEDCEISFQGFTDAYQLTPDDLNVPPVEYISINPKDYTPDFYKTDIIGEISNLKIAKGDKISTPFNRTMFELLENPDRAKNYGYEDIQGFCKEWNNSLPEDPIKILITDEYLNEILLQFKNVKSRNLISQLGDQLRFSSLEIRITKNVLTNFILKKPRELLQYSTSPGNELLGLFATKQKEICDIFNLKFDEEFVSAMNLEEFYIKNLNKPLDPLTEFIITVL